MQNVLNAVVVIVLILNTIELALYLKFKDYKGAVRVLNDAVLLVLVALLMLR
jgi:hypothetical protein